MFYSGKFIGDVRNAQDIKLAILAQGLCSTAQLARIESGIRSAEKLLFDSLYERLGKNTEKFTVLLDCDEYEQLLERIRICDCIDAGKYEEARERIEAYKKTTKNNIHRQYLCLVECEVMHRTHTTVAECMDKLMEGIRYTYPDFDIDNISKYYLSRLEMFIVQQYVRYMEQSGQNDRAAELYSDILNVLDSDRYDRHEREKLYGYVGYRLMKYHIDNGQYRNALEIGKKTYENIIDSGKWVFLTELKAGIIKCIEALGGDTTNEKEMSNAKRILSILQKMNDRYGVRRAEDYFPRYVEEYAVNVNDVIRKRRIMYGMTQEELAEGICDVTTISRLENNKHNLNDELRSRLLEKLKLPIDKYSPCTENSFNEKMLEKFKRISDDIKNGRYDRLIKLSNTVSDICKENKCGKYYELTKLSDIPSDKCVENKCGKYDRLIKLSNTASDICGENKCGKYNKLIKLPNTEENIEEVIAENSTVNDMAVDEALRRVAALEKDSGGVLVFENDWGIIDDLVFYFGSRGGYDKIFTYGSVFKPSYIEPMPYECEIASVIKTMEEGELLRELGKIEAAGEKFAKAIKLAVRLDEFEWLSRLTYLYAQNMFERKEKGGIFMEEECVELLEYSYALACVYDDRRRIDAIRTLCKIHNIIAKFSVLILDVI